MRVAPSAGEEDEMRFFVVVVVVVDCFYGSMLPLHAASTCERTLAARDG
jgi:hypothetical protein